jgi:hypothetical protein
MTPLIPISPLHALWIFIPVAILALPVSAPADVVAIHDRGERIRLVGREADALSRLCSDLMERSKDEGGVFRTEMFQFLRASEVVVEVQFDEVREFHVKPNQRANPQYLFIPLTGEFTGVNGDEAHIFAGVKQRFDLPGLPLLDLMNHPDEYGIVYQSVYMVPDALEPLRRAVAQYGVDAPRPTPLPTEAIIPSEWLTPAPPEPEQ